MKSYTEFRKVLATSWNSAAKIVYTAGRLQLGSDKYCWFKSKYVKDDSVVDGILIINILGEIR